MSGLYNITSLLSTREAVSRLHPPRTGINWKKILNEHLPAGYDFHADLRSMSISEVYRSLDLLEPLM